MLKRFLSVFGLCFALSLGAQAQVAPDIVGVLKEAPMKYVQEFAENMAKQVNASAPITLDAVTTVTGAMFTRANNTLTYQIKLTTDMRSDEFFQIQRAKLCAGKTVVVMMERTVQFVYVVTTPKYYYTASFNYFHC